MRCKESGGFNHNFGIGIMGCFNLHFASERNFSSVRRGPLHSYLGFECIWDSHSKSMLLLLSLFSYVKDNASDILTLQCFVTSPFSFLNRIKNLRRSVKFFIFLLLFLNFYFFHVTCSLHAASQNISRR